MKNHKQNWYHFSVEPKFGNKSGTILGNVPLICRKIVPIIRKKIQNLTQEIFVNLAPLKPPKIEPLIADFLYPL